MECAQALLSRLAELFGLNFLLFDADGGKLAETPTLAPVCQLVRSTPAGRQLCERGCHGLDARTGITDTRVEYCQGRMANLLVPVRFGSFFGASLVCNGFRIEGPAEQARDEVLLVQLAARLGVTPDALIEAHRRATGISFNRLSAFRLALDQLLPETFADSVTGLVKAAVGNQTAVPWETIAVSVPHLVPAEKVEIFALAPGGDVCFRTWPETPATAAMPAPAPGGTADGGGLSADGEGNVVVAVRGDGRDLAVLRIRPLAGRQWGDAERSRLGKLAAAVGETLLAVRTRKTESVLARLNPRLAKIKNHRERLQVLLEECAALLGCANGDVALRKYDDAALLKVVARYGAGSELLPIVVPAEKGITGRVLRERRAAVVPDIGRDADYCTLLSSPRPANLPYDDEHWRKFQGFLGQLQACVKFPLLVGDEALGVLCLHRPAAGTFDLDQVHVVQALAERAAVEAACVLVSEKLTPRIAPIREAVRGAEDLVAQVRAQKLEPAAARFWLYQHLADTALAESGGAYRTMVCLVDPNQTALAISALAERGGASGAGLDQVILLSRDSAATHAFKTGQSHSVEDTQQTGAHYLAVPPDRTRSCEAILLQAGSHRLGVLCVDWETTGACDPELRARLEWLAHRFAMAIETYDVDQAFARLDESLRRARAAEDTPPDYQDVLKTVAEMIGVHKGSLFLRRCDTGRYHLAAHLVHPDWVGQPDMHYEAGEGLTGWVIAHRKPLRLRDLRDSGRLKAVAPDLVHTNKITDNPNPEEELFSYLAVPIASATEVFGVLRFVDAPRQAFSSNDQHILETAASRLATFLAEGQQAKHGRALMRLSEQLLATHSQKEMARAVFAVLQETLGGDCACHLRVRDKLQEGSQPVTDALCQLAASQPDWVPAPLLRRKGEGIAGWVWEHRRRFVDDRVSRQAGPCAELGDQLVAAFFDRVGSAVCVPLDSGGDFVGTLLVMRRHPRAFAASEMTFIEEVGKFAGSGLLTAREREAQALELRLETRADDFLMGLLRQQTVRAQEQKLLVDVLDDLRRGLGGSLGWVGIPAGPQTHFSIVNIKGKPAADITGDPAAGGAAVPVAEVLKLTGPEEFRIILNPDQNPWVAGLLGRCRDRLRKLFASVQMCLLAMTTGGRTLAVFAILNRRGQAISYVSAQRARDMLRRIGELIDIGHRFEDHVHEIEVARPLALVGSFFSDLEHAIRKPIAHIKGAIEFLTERSRTAEQIQSKLALMQGARADLEACLEKLLSFGGLSRQRFGRCDLAAVVRAAAGVATARVPATALRLDLPEKPVWVHGLDNYLQQAVLFVLENALQAAAKVSAGLVQVSGAAATNGNARVEIADNGPGMDEETARRALEPFYSNKSNGTGLGLPAAFCILRSHDGVLELETRPGQGTKVAITLPLWKGAS
jgi:signal transduction histidine kinase/transcriptional regulator with GAF, ATPase, and Fis domain